MTYDLDMQKGHWWSQKVTLCMKLHISLAITFSWNLGLYFFLDISLNLIYSLHYKDANFLSNNFWDKRSLITTYIISLYVMFKDLLFLKYLFGLKSNFTKTLLEINDNIIKLDFCSHWQFLSFFLVQNDHYEARYKNRILYLGFYVFFILFFICIWQIL